VKLLDHYHFLGLKALGALLHLKFYRGAFFQGTISVRLDRGKMNKNVLTGRALDEPIPLGGIKPLYCTFFFHYVSLNCSAIEKRDLLRADVQLAGSLPCK